MNRLLAVFWDVDGTIADTELCGHKVAFNLAFNDFDLDWNWDDNKYLDLLKISGGFNRIIHYRNEINSDLSNEKCSMIQSRKRFHYKKLVKSGKIKVRQGVIRLMKELADLNIEQIIVTTSGRESLEPFLNNSLQSYLEYFSQIITFEDVKNHKPSPDAYDMAVRLSRKANKNCIVIEDSIIGVKAAKAANLHSLLTLPPWLASFDNIPRIASACVDCLGNEDKQTNLIYGKKLQDKFVDSNYLTNIIN